MNKAQADRFFETGCDYELRYRIPGVHKADRVARMGFLGRSHVTENLIFDARGPQRSTSGQFGGTQELSHEHIISAEEVPRVLSARHTERTAA